MLEPAAVDLSSLLERQPNPLLVAMLLELARDHEAVAAPLARLQLANQPARLSAAFRKTLTAWKRSKTFHAYGQAGAFGRSLETWLEQVERELLPNDAPAALALFEDFIESDCF